jgi:hypothetical protein
MRDRSLVSYAQANPENIRQDGEKKSGSRQEKEYGMNEKWNLF